MKGKLRSKEKKRRIPGIRRYCEAARISVEWERTQTSTCLRKFRDDGGAETLRSLAECAFERKVGGRNRVKRRVIERGTDAAREHLHASAEFAGARNDGAGAFSAEGGVVEPAFAGDDDVRGRDACFKVEPRGDERKPREQTRAGTAHEAERDAAGGACSWSVDEVR